MDYIVIAEWEDGYRLTVCPNEYAQNIFADKDEATDACEDIYKEMALAGMIDKDLPELTIHKVGMSLNKE